MESLCDLNLSTLVYILEISSFSMHPWTLTSNLVFSTYIGEKMKGKKKKKTQKLDFDANIIINI